MQPSWEKAKKPDECRRQEKDGELDRDKMEQDGARQNEAVKHTRLAMMGKRCDDLTEWLVMTGWTCVCTVKLP